MIDEDRIDQTLAESFPASDPPSWTLGVDEAPLSPSSAIELEIPARTRNVGAFDVGRVLPAPARRMVGPFAFLDHMGPVALHPGHGLDVRPHPHIGLATVTYLFEGEVLHRDSLGSAQRIRPGAINWMVAGRGIVHSERTPDEVRASGGPVHGLQLWVALPRAVEESEPLFAHHAAETIPELAEPGVHLRVLLGSAFGVTSPVEVASPLFYVEARLDAGARMSLPSEHAERAVYVIDGSIACGPRTIAPRTMAVFRRGAEVVLDAVTSARFVILGGEPLDGPRYIFWNFVSSSKERLEEAARDWRAERFPLVPGDEHERIALDADPSF